MSDITPNLKKPGDFTTGAQYVKKSHVSKSPDIQEKLVSKDGLIDSEHAELRNIVAENIGGEESSTFNTINGAIDEEDKDAIKNNDVKVEDAFEFENSMSLLMSGSMLEDPNSAIHNKFTKFSRYGTIDPHTELVSGTREYLFFSKPDLHLFDKGKENTMVMNPELRFNPFFQEAINHYPYTCMALQQTYDNGVFSYDLKYNTSNKFIQILSNMVTSTLDLPDISAGDVAGNQNLYQIGTSYREGSIVSDLQYDFTLEFKDTKYMDVYMFFKVYDEYFRYKYEEELTPVSNTYIINRILPEAISIWKVIADDTGRIIYWAKAIGCMPMTVPRGSVSNIENQIKFSVNFKAQFVKDMDPVNLLELNNLSLISLGLLPNNIIESSNLNAKLNSKFIGDSVKDNWMSFPYVLTPKLVKNANGKDTLLKRHGDKSNNAINGFYKLTWIG